LLGIFGDGDIDGDGLILGDMLGEKLGEILIEIDGLNDGDLDILRDGLPVRLLTLILGEIDADLLGEREGLALGLMDIDGLIDGLTDGLLLGLALILIILGMLGYTLGLPILKPDRDAIGDAGALVGAV
jgi:hypothetical protein